MLSSCWPSFRGSDKALIKRSANSKISSIICLEMYRMNKYKGLAKIVKLTVGIQTPKSVWMPMEMSQSLR